MTGEVGAAVVYCMRIKFLFQSLGHAVAVFSYVAGVAWLMFNTRHFPEGAPTILVPIGMLLLFILSASITGTLVLGKPIILYLSGANPTL